MSLCVGSARPSPSPPDETALQPWAYEAEASQIPELMRFVQRLRLDWEAVENALLFASSQGQVEGQVNRLKVGHRDKAMDVPVLPSYRLAWWEQATAIEQGPKWSIWEGFPIPPPCFGRNE